MYMEIDNNSFNSQGIYQFNTNGLKKVMLMINNKDIDKIKIEYDLNETLEQKEAKDNNNIIVIDIRFIDHFNIIKNSDLINPIRIYYELHKSI